MQTIQSLFADFAQDIDTHLTKMESTSVYLSHLKQGTSDVNKLVEMADLLTQMEAKVDLLVSRLNEEEQMLQKATVCLSLIYIPILTYIGSTVQNYTTLTTCE